MTLPSPYSFFHERTTAAENRQAGTERVFATAVPVQPREIRRGWHAIALGTSAALHMVILAALLLNPTSRTFGVSGPDLGTGMAVSLVTGFASGGPETELAPAEPVEIDAGLEDVRREVDLTLGTAPAAKDSPPESEARDARPSLPRLAMMRIETYGEAANTFEGLTGASDALGGSATANSDLLAQIAGCLPPSFRPNLTFGQLTLSIGADGRLAAAPAVTSALPRVGAEERRVADRIVQAALLCGPYAHPDAVGRTITLPADFSQVPAAQDGPAPLLATHP